MNPDATLLQRFVEYAQAFEKTYVDDDWTRLEPYFAPDAVYRVVGSTSWDCEVRGCAQVLAAIRKFVNEFDRKCTRTVRPAGAPLVGADSVRVTGVATYTRGDSDELALQIEMIAQYRDGRIIRLSDVFPAENEARVRAWIERWASDLQPSYT
jgi:hypothetical protein